MYLCYERGINCKKSRGKTSVVCAPLCVGLLWVYFLKINYFRKKKHVMRTCKITSRTRPQRAGLYRAIRNTTYETLRVRLDSVNCAYIDLQLVVRPVLVLVEVHHLLVGIARVVRVLTPRVAPLVALAVVVLVRVGKHAGDRLG